MDCGWFWTSMKGGKKSFLNGTHLILNLGWEIFNIDGALTIKIVSNYVMVFHIFVFPPHALFFMSSENIYKEYFLYIQNLIYMDFMSNFTVLCIVYSLFLHNCDDCATHPAQTVIPFLLGVIILMLIIKLAMLLKKNIYITI